MCALSDWRKVEGHWVARRAAQAQFWFHEELRQGVLAQLDTTEAQAGIRESLAKVAALQMAPERAAAEVLSALNIQTNPKTRK